MFHFVSAERVTLNCYEKKLFEMWPEAGGKFWPVQAFFFVSKLFVPLSSWEISHKGVGGTIFYQFQNLETFFWLQENFKKLLSYKLARALPSLTVLKTDNNGPTCFTLMSFKHKKYVPIWNQGGSQKMLLLTTTGQPCNCKRYLSGSKKNKAESKWSHHQLGDVKHQG